MLTVRLKKGYKSTGDSIVVNSIDRSELRNQQTKGLSIAYTYNKGAFFCSVYTGMININKNIKQIYTVVLTVCVGAI